MKYKLLNAIEAIKTLEISRSRKCEALIALRLAINEADDLTFDEMYELNIEIDRFI